MRRLLVIIAVGIAILVAGFFALNQYIYKEKQAVVVPNADTAGGGNGSEDVIRDYKDGAYIIEGERVKLTDGLSEVMITCGPDERCSSGKYITKYFGNEAVGDLNGDGEADVAFILTRNTGGSGTFFYAVAAIAQSGGYVGTDGVLLGDRIAPQTTEIRDGLIIVNYADRKPGEPMVARPSVGKSLWLKLDARTLRLGEVVQNFEGEADPSRMTLGMKTWTWISALYNDGTRIAPKDADAFTVTFSDNGQFTATTDCHDMRGAYEVRAGAIAFRDIAPTTKIYCEESQESEFVRILGDASGYHFTSKGELVLDLKFDSGSAVFR